MIIPRHLRWLWLTLAVVFLDRATKVWIESRAKEYFPHTIVPNFLVVVSSRNPGIAFSLFASPGSLLARILLVAGTTIIICFVAWLLVTTREPSKMYLAGLALILGGATGNVTDRIIHGAVTDFVQVWLKYLPFTIFNPWPTFNVADSAVTIGAMCIVIDVLFTRQPRIEA